MCYEVRQEGSQKMSITVRRERGVGDNGASHTQWWSEDIIIGVFKILKKIHYVRGSTAPKQSCNMIKLNKREAFLALLALWIIIPLLYQSAWIFSRTSTAEIYAADAARTSRRSFSMMYAAYTVGSVTYQGSYFRDEGDVENRHFTVRYLSLAPGISRKDSFAGNWASPLIFIIFFSLITSIAFIRKDIIADQAVFFIRTRMPFVKLENNSIANYEEHTIETGQFTDAEQVLKNRLEAEADLFKQNEVSASVYKFNPNAIAIFGGYLFLFFWFFQILLTEKSVGVGIILLGALLVFVPLFVQNTNNPTFKAKIPDEGSLVFSIDGVQYKGESYAISDIEAAVVYLESFQGFKYKERVSTGTDTSVSAGDNNKISYRYKGQIIDLTFILEQFSDYWSFKNLLMKWSASGVNVVLEKVFEDDFVIQEIVKYDMHSKV